METEIVVEEEKEEEEEEMPFDLAGTGSRLISYLIDWLVFVMISLILVNVMILTSYDVNVAIIVAFLYVLVSVAYFTYFFGKGQTPGMMAMKIKLIGVDGTYHIGYGKGFVRLIGMIISSLPFNLGSIWILIDKKKQGWHDKIAELMSSRSDKTSEWGMKNTKSAMTNRWLSQILQRHSCPHFSFLQSPALILLEVHVLF